jgi:hypothetical protein
MNDMAVSGGKPEALARRFDQKFIEDHQLIERYLEGKLPYKGARELEAWCRSHPEYLDGLKLIERTHFAMKLLEASGKQVDLSEPALPWWKTIYFQVGLAVLAAASLLGLLALSGKYALQNSTIADLHERLSHGSLLPPASARTERIQPDRIAGLNKSKVYVDVKAKPELVDLHVDMSYTKLNVFRVQMEKRDQGRVLTIDNLMKDSNNELKIAFNSSALSPGQYSVEIDGRPFRGEPIGEGWLQIEAH